MNELKKYIYRKGKIICINNKNNTSILHFLFFFFFFFFFYNELIYINILLILINIY